MKKLICLTLLLGGCATVPPQDGGQSPDGGPAEATCDASTITPLVGKAISPDVEAQALRLTGAKRIRVLRPGDAATMDYLQDRLNLVLDAQDRVAQANCG